ncbi:MAG: hypothetical protein LPJ89_03965 [Hymenobacteraceae bacterium]|nr:hypothetical protein [Hymenobacteraceae bacterium]MDX5395137.1 hypothetical protein [Hymenobacteraceae bacterium]MDX5442921.1 hypothetical protein [Hymenobacteraceae bacterium]MDX5511178.1 hypothetical protein [Hymenobacteraceae bacterium]
MKKKKMAVPEELLENLYQFQFEGLQPPSNMHNHTGILRVIDYKYLELYYFGGYWFSYN